MRVHGVLPPVFTPFLSLSTAFQLSGHPTCTFYRLGRAATSSARLYWESFGKGTRHVVTIPSGFAVFPKEISPPIREWVADSYTNIVHWERYDKGGHFAAFEVPEVFVAEIRSMFRRYRPGF